MEVPITQSEVWQDLEKDLGEKTVFEKQDGYQFLAIIKKTKAGNYLFVPYGPLAEDQKSFKKALAALKTLAKAHKAIFTRIEPRTPEMAQFLPKTAKKVHDIDPKDTWVLDLTPERTTLISNFSQGTRTRYNNYAKKGITVTTTKDPKEIKHLVRLQNKLYRKKGLHAFSEKYLKTELAQPFATLYLVHYEDKIIAASLFFDHEGTRYYMQSATDQDYKKLPATVALLTTAIFDAKDQGIKLFDFWGIAPDDAPKDHPWQGFTEFKKSFGGEARHYAGTYDIIENPLKYHLFIAAQKLSKLTKVTKS